ncbi:hypothetical protein ACFPER_13065 [Agromyces aurantiacus]|uniref:Uncharacterized protein n=1 Tax=Agromyces aurantiacus TaxID=165814 RepID=A0ABV9RBK0_9MICO|nr:hypothetical protein [Agromyces aurantiacus]MBM7504414.1 hypothetical protein [Agromyces aurantiacus]
MGASEMLDEMKRSELEARVYSRAGADDPREEHLDPVTGRRVWVSDSEWQLRLDDMTGAGRDASGDAPPPTAIASPPPRAADVSAAARRARSSGRMRRRPPAVVAALMGVLAGAGFVAVWSWADDAAHRPPAVRVEITPSAEPEANTWDAPLGAAFDVFRDRDRSPGSMPGWLTDLFPASRIAQLVGPADEIRGAGVYAAVSYTAIACLVVRLDADGMIWNCTSLEHVADDGMVLRTPIPAGLATGRDDDGDGVAGDAVHNDLLVVEWHDDGTFLVTRTAG